MTCISLTFYQDLTHNLPSKTLSSFEFSSVIRKPIPLDPLTRSKTQRHNMNEIATRQKNTLLFSSLVFLTFVFPPLVIPLLSASLLHLHFISPSLYLLHVTIFFILFPNNLFTFSPRTCFSFSYLSHYSNFDVHSLPPFPFPLRQEDLVLFRSLKTTSQNTQPRLVINGVIPALCEWRA